MTGGSATREPADERRMCAADPAGKEALMRRWQPPVILGEAGQWLAERAGLATGWTGQHVRHVAGIVRQGRNPAAQVYESIGSECFVALAPGWLNLGLWEGRGGPGRRRRGQATAGRRGRGWADQRGGGIPLPLPPCLLRGVLPGAPARWRAEHHGYLHRAMAAKSRRAGSRPGPAETVRASSRRGDDR